MISLKDDPSRKEGDSKTTHLTRIQRRRQQRKHSMLKMQQMIRLITLVQDVGKKEVSSPEVSKALDEAILDNFKASLNERLFLLKN